MITEIQRGEYPGEDDIARLEDDFVLAWQFPLYRPATLSPESSAFSTRRGRTIEAPTAMIALEEPEAGALDLLG